MGVWGRSLWHRQVKISFCFWNISLSLQLGRIAPWCWLFRDTNAGEKIQKYNLFCKDQGRWKAGWKPQMTAMKKMKQASWFLRRAEENSVMGADQNREDSWKFTFEGNPDSGFHLPPALLSSPIWPLFSPFTTPQSSYPIRISLRLWMIATVSLELNSNSAPFQQMEKLRPIVPNPIWLNTT